MNELHLLILVLTSWAGAILFALKEAAMIVAGRKLNKVLLTVLRFTLAILVLTPFLPRPVEIHTLVLCLIMMTGAWAPVHRLCLNARRIHLGHKIPLTHLNFGIYDTLLFSLIPEMKFRFKAMAIIETLIALIAGAIIIQTT